MSSAFRRSRDCPTYRCDRTLLHTNNESITDHHAPQVDAWASRIKFFSELSNIKIVVVITEPKRLRKLIGVSGKPLQAVRQELPLHEPDELWRHLRRQVPQEQTRSQKNDSWIVDLLSQNDFLPLQPGSAVGSTSHRLLLLSQMKKTT